MNRTILLAIIAISSFATCHAQQISDVHIKDFTLELNDDKHLNVDIDLDLSDLSIKPTQVVVLTPCIVNGDERLMLKSIGVYGRNRRIFYERNDENKPTSQGDIDLSPADIDGVVEYATTTRFLEWMDGCRLELVRTDYGCCGTYQMVAQEQLVERFPLERFVPELIYLRPQREVVKTRELSGSAYIDFPVSRTEINPNYRNNVSELNKIIGTIDSVKLDKDVTIKSIFIKGYASPESPYKNNTYLAKGRTEALKSYVESLYHFGKGFITTAYEPEDWAGLERYVESSSLPHKREILEAIRSDREPDNKEWYIKSNWRDDYRYLLDNCYPALRHSDYTIEYEVRSYVDPVDIEKVLRTAPQNLSLEEFYILAETYESGSDEFNELFETAVRMYPNDPVANLNAANSAIQRNDYRNAARYLDKAGDLPEAVYTRGVLEVYLENSDKAKAYFEEAHKLGVPQAESAVVEVSKNRNIVKKTR